MMSFTKYITCILMLFAFTTTLQAQNKSTADDYFRQAEEFKKNQQPDSAVIYFEKAANEYQSVNNTEKFIDSYNQIGIILTRQDIYEKAKTYLEKALATGLAKLDSNNLAVATTYLSLGVVYNAEENYKQSLKYHYKALSIRLLKLDYFNAQVATSYGNIGNVHRNNKELNQSIDSHLKAMEIREKLFGSTSPEIIDSYVGLGNAYRDKKEYAYSLEYFNKALNNKIVQRGEGHKDLAKYYKNVSDVHYLMGNKEQGDSFKSKSDATLSN